MLLEYTYINIMKRVLLRFKPSKLAILKSEKLFCIVFQIAKVKKHTALVLREIFLLLVLTQPSISEVSRTHQEYTLHLFCNLLSLQ